MTDQKPNFVVLVILDGWGVAPAGPGNAVTSANTPNINNYLNIYPHTLLDASGEAVGLPRGEPGNSETGHLNLGAGQIVYQDLPRINLSIADGSFLQNAAFLQAAAWVKKNHSTLHLMGLLGGGGVHANTEHLFALLHFAKEQQISNVVLQLFTDGRDSPPTAALTYLANVKSKLNHLGIGRVGSVMGRFWAMDRDNRWSRTEKAYLALTEGQGKLVHSAEEAVRNSYAEGKSDEFIEPSVVVDQSGIPIGLIKEKDAVIFFNFRIDRPRQLAKAFVLPEFNQNTVTKSFDPYQDKYLASQMAQHIVQEPVFNRKKYLADLFFVTMTEYEKDLLVEAVAFPPQKVDSPLSQVLSDHGLRQLHISETEKERFVTYYFDGFREQPFPEEEWLIVPSLTKVSTYDLAPEMSALLIKDKIITKIKEKNFNFILVNFANPDMVGHSGKMEPTVKALETVDQCLGEIVQNSLPLNGLVIVTADHGNAEELINKHTGEIDTEHSDNPVPFIIIGQGLEPATLQRGILADVAPTVLKILQVPKPPIMTGKALI